MGTEHLLLGLLREQEGVAAQVLISLDLEPDTIRSKVASLQEGTSDSHGLHQTDDILTYTPEERVCHDALLQCLVSIHKLSTVLISTMEVVEAFALTNQRFEEYVDRRRTWSRQQLDE